MLVKKYKILGKCFSQVGDKTRFVMKIESTEPSHHPHNLKEHSIHIKTIPAQMIWEQLAAF
jgi:hypothetical protein